MQRGEVRDPIKVLLLCLLTCGIYNLYWIFITGDEVNKGLGREEFNMVKEILLTFVTCGFWGFWFYWRYAHAVVEVQEKWGVKPQMDAPILFLMAFVSLMPFFVQQGLNAAWEHGRPMVGQDVHSYLGDDMQNPQF